MVKFVSKENLEAFSRSLAEKIGNLMTDVDVSGIQSGISDLQGQIDNLDIDSINDRLSNLEEAIRDISDSNNDEVVNGFEEINNSISYINTRIDVMYQMLTDLDNDIDSINTGNVDLTDINDQIANINNQITELTNRINSLQDIDIDSLYSYIDSRLAQSATIDDINSINNDIENIKSDIEFITNNSGEGLSKDLNNMYWWSLIPKGTICMHTGDSLLVDSLGYERAPFIRTACIYKRTGEIFRNNLYKLRVNIHINSFESDINSFSIDYNTVNDIINKFLVHAKSVKNFFNVKLTFSQQGAIDSSNNTIISKLEWNRIVDCIENWHDENGNIAEQTSELTQLLYSSTYSPSGYIEYSICPYDVIGNTPIEYVDGIHRDIEFIQVNMRYVETTEEVLEYRLFINTNEFDTWIETVTNNDIKKILRNIYNKTSIITNYTGDRDVQGLIPLTVLNSQGLHYLAPNGYTKNYAIGLENDLHKLIDKTISVISTASYGASKYFFTIKRKGDQQASMLGDGDIDILQNLSEQIVNYTIEGDIQTSYKKDINTFNVYNINFKHADTIFERVGDGGGVTSLGGSVGDILLDGEPNATTNTPVNLYIDQDTNTLKGAVNLDGNINVTASFPVGSVILWGGNSDNIPEGWKKCDGEEDRPNMQNIFVDADGNSMEFIIKV